jgi:hypothetical protein
MTHSELSVYGILSFYLANSRRDAYCLESDDGVQNLWSLVFSFSISLIPDGMLIQCDGPGT